MTDLDDAAAAAAAAAAAPRPAGGAAAGAPGPAGPGTARAREAEAEAPRARTRRLEILADAAGRLLAATDPDEVLGPVFRALAEGFGIDLSLGYVPDEARPGGLRLASAFGLPEEARAAFARLAPGEAVCGRAAAERRPVCVEALQAPGAPAEAAALRALGVRAYAAFPLPAGDGRPPLGTLSFGSRTRDRFPAEERAFLGAVAQHIAAVRGRLRAEAALRAGEERLRLVLANVRDHAVLTTDADGRVAEWTAGAAAVFGWGAAEVVGRPFDVLFTPEDRAAGVPGRELAAARREGTAPDARWHLRRDGGRVFVEGGTTALRGPDGAVRGFLKIGRDATARKAAEERQALLAREVDHRAKNALAVVQAILRLTPRDDAAAFAAAVEGRVAALARAQTLLAGERWAGADLRALLQGELAPFAAAGQRVELAGPAVALPPGAAQPLAMAVHELATNAAKHGALSADGGRVAVSWRLDGGGGGGGGGGPPAARLRLRWAEAGGPPVAGPPARRGFGSRVLEATVRGQLGGAAALAWEPAGLVCELEVPLARAAAAASEAAAAGLAAPPSEG